jgi:uncharacterized protein (DUF2249 family)/hemerythrin-like domain-containing protein
MQAAAIAVRSRHFRSIECHGKPEVILAAFDVLVPGEAVNVVSKHEPGKLLRRLQDERAGLFEWSPLEAGPARWRTELTRRNATLGAKRKVHEALAWDHDRLEAILGGVFDARSGADFARAGALFAEFSLGLRRHIRFEEQILFPAFEAHAGLPRHAGPTGVMCAEHREIEALLEGLDEVAGLPGQAAEILREDLVRILGWHNQREENVLYPGIDRLLTEVESDGLVASIQAS